jgi:IS6 family transposase
MKTATATIKGFEVMRMIRRGHCLTCKRGVQNEVLFVGMLFGIAAQHQKSKLTLASAI